MDLLTVCSPLASLLSREPLSDPAQENTHSARAERRKGMKWLTVIPVGSGESPLSGNSLFSSLPDLWEEIGAPCKKKPNSVEERKTPSEESSAPASSPRCHRPQ